MSLGVLILSFLSGVLGRMGGSDKYPKLWRRLGCSLMVIIALWLLTGFNLSYWWLYLIIIGLHYAAFMGYWDWLFGFDNLWFSGFMTGMAFFPLIFIDIGWWIILLRAILLAVIWGCLNKYLPQKGFLVWRRDVAEEFLRYFSGAATMFILCK